MSPSGSMITPEPSEFCTRSCGRPKGERLPKKRRKKGSSAKGEALVRTTRRENTFTTAGAACFTIGAKESRIASRDLGAVCASADDATTSASKRDACDFLMGPGL